MCYAYALWVVLMRTFELLNFLNFQHWLLCAFACARPMYSTVYSNGRTRNSRYIIVVTIINKLSLTVHTKDDSVEYTKEFLLEVDIMVLSKLTKTIYLYTNNIHVA